MPVRLLHPAPRVAAPFVLLAPLLAGLTLLSAPARAEPVASLAARANKIRVTQPPYGKLLGTRPLSNLSPRANSAVVQAQGAGRVFRLATDDAYWLDTDGDGELSPLDTFVAYGTAYSPRGLINGYWQLSMTIVHPEGLGSGLLQLNLRAGTLTVDIGPVHDGGIRSGIPSRPILGGTGNFANRRGNAGLFQDDRYLYVQLGVR